MVVGAGIGVFEELQPVSRLEMVGVPEHIRIVMLLAAIVKNEIVVVVCIRSSIRIYTRIRHLLKS